MGECGLGEGRDGAGGDEVGGSISHTWIGMLLARIAKPHDTLVLTQPARYWTLSPMRERR